MRVNLWSVVLIAFCLCCLPGCMAADTSGFKLDMSQFNWQTAALIALAYFANSKGHLAGLAKMAKGLLQSLKILPAEKSTEALTAEQLAALLADLFTKLQGQPELQAKVVDLMTAASASAATAKAVANASAK